MAQKWKGNENIKLRERNVNWLIEIVFPSMERQWVIFIFECLKINGLVVYSKMVDFYGSNPIQQFCTLKGFDGWVLHTDKKPAWQVAQTFKYSKVNVSANANRVVNVKQKCTILKRIFERVPFGKKIRFRLFHAKLSNWLVVWCIV